MHSFNNNKTVMNDHGRLLAAVFCKKRHPKLLWYQNRLLLLSIYITLVLGSLGLQLLQEPQSCLGHHPIPPTPSFSSMLSWHSWFPPIFVLLLLLLLLQVQAMPKISPSSSTPRPALSLSSWCRPSPQSSLRTHLSRPPPPSASSSMTASLM